MKFLELHELALYEDELIYDGEVVINIDTIEQIRPGKKFNEIEIKKLKEKLSCPIGTSYTYINIANKKEPMRVAEDYLSLKYLLLQKNLMSDMKL